MLLYDTAPTPAAIAAAMPAAPLFQGMLLTNPLPREDVQSASAAEAAPPAAAGSQPDPRSAETKAAVSVPPSAPPPAPAAKTAGQDDHFLGDWFGLRTDLVRAGITPVMAYTESSLGNVRGGTRSRFDTAGQFRAGLEFDLPKVTGGNVPGTFQVGLVRRHGLAESFSNTSGLQPLVNPLSIQGRGSIWRVSQLWYKVSLGKLNVKFGRMFMNEDFNKENCDFISGYFCLGEVTRAFSTVWPTSPVSQWGIRLQYALTDKLALKTAVYQYNPKNLEVDRPLYIGWKGATGVILPAELEWKPRLLGRLPGTYTLGAYYSNSDQADPVLNTDRQIRLIAGGSPLIRHNEWGVYFDSRQQLIAPRPDGAHALTAFFNAAVLSRQSTRNRSVWGGGLTYSGLIPGRPKDELGVALGKARINERTTRAQEYVNANGGNIGVQRSEYSVETYYNIQVMRGFSFQPDAQFIFNPGGYHDRRNAVLLGFKTSVTF